MIVFGGHDPGSINHTRPICELARAQGRKVEALFLRPADGSVWGGREQAERQLDEIASKGGPIEAVVLGISTNRAELQVVQLCNERKVPCALVVDFAPGHRLDAGPLAQAIPALVLVTNGLAAADVVSKLSIPPERVVVGGSAYLEELAMDRSPARMSPEEIRASFGLPAACDIVPFFLSPDDMVPDASTALESCLRSWAELLADIKGGLPQGKELAVIIRKHPRNEKSTVARIAEVCREDWGGSLRVIMDMEATVDNKSLARASTRSFSMGSTVSVECHAWGAPSAYYQRAWDPSRIEAIMACLPVTRIKTSEALNDFLFSGGCAGGGGGGDFNVENCIGAAQRSWEAVEAALLM